MILCQLWTQTLAPASVRRPSAASTSAPYMRADDAELPMRVAPTVDGRGHGAFADAHASTNQFICAYRGELLTLEEQAERYAVDDPEYLFHLGADLYLDANASTHASRYFNHDEHGTLNFTVSYDEQRVEFFAARAIAPGEELTFDYGVGFWMASRSVPLAGTDSRSFELRAETADEKPRGPPPPVPMTVSQLDALDAAPASERRLAMLRCLDYLGAERGDAGELLVPTSLGGTAEVVVDASGESLAQLDSACRSLLELLEARSSI